MGRAFPTFGIDAAGRQALFVGETHDDNTSLMALAWQTMFLAGRLDAIFLEYYPFGQGPVSPRIAEIAATDGATLAGFSGQRAYTDFESEKKAKVDNKPALADIEKRVRQRFYSELAQLKYQCDRYRIRLEGWNRPSGDSTLLRLLRSTPQWNEEVTQELAGRLETLGVKSYIIFGGKLHGPLMQNCSLFKGNLPCFHSHDAQSFVEYDLVKKPTNLRELEKLGQQFTAPKPPATLFGFMYLKKMNISYYEP